jgi:hypothetical protein
LGNTSPANYDIIFRIFDASSSGNLKWAEKQTVTIDKGQFSVILGEGAANGSDPRGPLDTVFTAPDASDRFIEVTVKINNTDVTIAPRLRLVTSPYSFLAKNATGVVGADGAVLMASTAPNSMTVGGQLTATSFVGNGAGLTGLTAGQIPVLDASKITTGTLADARLSGNVPIMSSGKIGDGNLPSTQSGKTFNSAVGITANNVLEFGVGLGKEVNNGKIGYQTFDNALDIVGAGSAGTDRRINFHSQGGMSFFANGGSAHYGHFAIGGAPNDAPLYVYGSTNPWLLSNSPDGFANNSGFNGCCGLGTVGGAYFYVSIAADQWIEGAGFVANSDRRIKDIVGLSDTKKDLETIQKLRVTNYRPVDKVREGDAMRKGFIAQEVISIIPEAVTKRRNNVPDIYAKAVMVDYDEKSKTLGVTLPKNHGLSKGEVVAMYFDNVAAPQVLTVTGTPSTDRFEVESKISPKEIFVYGRRVDDFHSVNYDHIFTTGIGAIQELSKQLQAKDARIASLEEKTGKVEALEHEIAALKKQLASNQQNFDTLEAMVKKLGTVVASKTDR